MENQEKLTVLQAAWSAEAADLLRPCFTVVGALEMIGAQVESGRATLFKALAESGELVAVFVLRVDDGEGVIVAAVGPLGALPALLPHMEQRFAGCRSVRFHTARPAMVRVMLAAGYHPQEIVMRREL